MLLRHVGRIEDVSQNSILIGVAISHKGIIGSDHKCTSHVRPIGLLKVGCGAISLEAVSKQ